jgi:hypothetical protein
MTPLFVIAFIHCGSAGPCEITYPAPYLRYSTYEACMSDSRLFDISEFRRQFGSRPQCIEAKDATKR